MLKVIVSYLDMAYGGFEHKHAQTVMSDLGISYERAVPQSMTDCWVFYGCSNIPEDLPSYVRVVEVE